MNLQRLKAKYDSLTEKKNITDEQQQLAAVQQDGDALQYCLNPSEAVPLAAVQQDGDALRYFHHPSEAVQPAAVQHNCYALKYCLPSLF